jgi:secondary thiamine-phosphate synthase enzyme
MEQARHRIDVMTNGPGLFEITGEIERWLDDQTIGAGLLTVFIAHTSASLLVQENADPDVRYDLDAFFRRLVTEDPALYRHRDEGLDDMPAHIRAALGQVQISIPVDNGRMLLGTWQGIYVFEHRRNRHRRTVQLHLIGD